MTVTISYVWGWRECSAYAILGSEHLNTLIIQRVVGVVVVTMVCHELGHARINSNNVQFTKPATAKRYFFVCDLSLRRGIKLKQTRLSFRKTTNPEDNPDNA